jgi:hypothetical protein
MTFDEQRFETSMKVNSLRLQLHVLTEETRLYEKLVLARWQADRLILGRILRSVAIIGALAMAGTLSFVVWGRVGLVRFALVILLAPAFGLLLARLVYLAVKAWTGIDAGVSEVRPSGAEREKRPTAY